MNTVPVQKSMVGGGVHASAVPDDEAVVAQYIRRHIDGLAEGNFESSNLDGLFIYDTNDKVFSSALALVQHGIWRCGKLCHSRYAPEFV
jgi:hypothetical protein